MDLAKRRDIGITGALVVVIQALASYSSSNSISTQVESLREQVIQAKLEREEFFVRKTEMKSEMKYLSAKMDKLSDQIAIIHNKIEENYSSLDDLDELTETCQRD